MRVLQIVPVMLLLAYNYLKSLLFLPFTLCGDRFTDDIQHRSQLNPRMYMYGRSLRLEHVKPLRTGKCPLMGFVSVQQRRVLGEYTAGFKATR